MKKSELIAKGFTTEQIKYIFAENGKDINAEKIKTSNALKELEELKNQFENIEIDGVDAKELEPHKLKEINILNDKNKQQVCVNFEKVKDMLKIQITFPIHELNIEK